MHFELKRLSLDNPSVLELYCQKCSLRALFREVSHTDSQKAEMEKMEKPVWGCSHEDFLVQCRGITVTRESHSTSMLLNQQ